jgi:hydrogenase maturation protease
VDRGDDAVGQVVAAQVATGVATSGMLGVEVVVHEDPTVLVDLMAPDGQASGPGRQLVVVVDAVRAGTAGPTGWANPRPGPGPGEVLVLETGAGQPPLPARTDPGPAGTHGIGLAGALELARALDRLPPRVVVVGVVGTDFGHGLPLTPAVAAAVPEAVATVLDLMHVDS